MAIRIASMAVSKQSAGDWAAITGTGASPLRPNITCSRSACSVLVGMPVLGPARWTSMTISGSSVITPRPMVSALSATPGPGGGGHAEMAGEARAERGADAGDLVLGLEGGDAEPLVLAQLVQHVGGRGDRVEPRNSGSPAFCAAGDQPVRQGEVAGDLPVAAGRHRGRGDLVGDGEHLGGLAERVAGLEGGDVGVADGRLVGELGGRGS